MSLTRRFLLKASLAALPAFYASRVFGQTMPAGTDALDPSRLPPILNGLFKASDVRLLPGSPFYDRQELHRTKKLASYEPDKLLYPYRALAGLPQADGVNGGYAGLGHRIHPRAHDGALPFGSVAHGRGNRRQGLPRPRELHRRRTGQMPGGA